MASLWIKWKNYKIDLMTMVVMLVLWIACSLLFLCAHYFFHSLLPEMINIPVKDFKIAGIRIMDMAELGIYMVIMMKMLNAMMNMNVLRSEDFFDRSFSRLFKFYTFLKTSNKLNLFSLKNNITFNNKTNMIIIQYKYKELVYDFSVPYHKLDNFKGVELYHSHLLEIRKLIKLDLLNRTMASHVLDIIKPKKNKDIF